MRRNTYWAWYTVNEDENDTYAELNSDNILTDTPKDLGIYRTLLLRQTCSGLAPPA